MKVSRVRYSYELVELARELRRDMTPAEKKLWYLLKTLPWKFRRQRPIGRYIVDFYCAEAKLVIEVDGDSHFAPEGQARDAERTAYLEQHNLRILRFTNTEVMEGLEGIHQRITKAIRVQLGSRPQPGLSASRP